MKFAVIGATQNKDKYGYIVFNYLKNKGFEVFPVNPNYQEIDGYKAYKDVFSVPLPIDFFVFVTPPQVSIKILKQLNLLKEKTDFKVWFQPGSEDDNCIKFCKANNIAFVSQACIMHSNLDDLNNSYII